MKGQEAKTTKAYSGEIHSDTLISYDTITTYPDEFQAHLERISDFLVEEKIWEATKDGVKFFDVSGEFQKKKAQLPINNHL